MTKSNMTVDKIKSEMVKEFDKAFKIPKDIPREEFIINAESAKQFLSDQIDIAYSKGREEVDSGNVSMTIEVAMGYIEMGQYKKALEHLEVAQKLLTPELQSLNQKELKKMNKQLDWEKEFIKLTDAYRTFGSLDDPENFEPYISFDRNYDFRNFMIGVRKLIRQEKQKSFEEGRLEAIKEFDKQWVDVGIDRTPYHVWVENGQLRCLRGTHLDRKKLKH